MGFQADVRTATRSNGAGSDHTVPSLGALNLNGMPNADALGGPKPGSDCKLIHGNDYTEYIDKNRYTEILLKDDRHIHQTLYELVEQQVTLEYQKGRHLIVTVLDQTEVHGDRKLDVDMHDDETYAVHREVHEPVNFEWKGLEMGAKGVSIDGKGLSLETTATTIGIEGLKIVTGLFTESNELIEDQLRNFFGLTKGLDLRVGVLALRMDPRVNAGPTVSVSAPFGA